MKKYIFLSLVLSVVLTQIKAQTISNYSVVRSTGNTYNSIVSIGIPFSSWRNNTSYIVDDNRSYQHDIGFDFWYNGIRYTKFSVSTNGYLDFSSSTATGGPTTGAYGYQNTQFSASGGTLEALAPFYDDQTTQGAADPLGESIKYLLTGTSPNQILTVEWTNMAVYGNTTPSLNYQVKLYEKTGKIEYCYGTMTNGTPTFSYTCGINGNVNTILLTQQTANTATFSSAAQNALSIIPESFSKLSFTPPTPTTVSGTMSFGTVTNNSIVINWPNWASNEVGYVIYYSQDNVNFDFLTQTAANAVSYTASSLLPGTTYYFKLMAVTEGGVSDALTGSQTTLAATTIYSAQTGAWSSTSTWVGGVVPTSTNNVVIKNTHTVSITSNASCYNLTVGEGGAATLEYSGRNARTLTISGDLTINTNAIFYVNAGSNATHSFISSGNIVNDGTLNFYVDSRSICNATFNKNGNQTLSGVGATTNFNLITLDMGTSSSNIFEVTSSTFSSSVTSNYLTISNGTFKYSGLSDITPFSTAYTIPLTGGLWVNSANATVNTGNSLTITGDVTVSAGTLNIGNASDENLISGGGQITVSGGTLNIAGRLDRTFATTITKLNISSGTINVPTVGSTSTTISPFEMSVNGSVFEMSGGKIVIQRAGGGTSYLGVNTTNGTLNVSGGTLQIGDASTPASSIISINSIVSFADLNVNSSNVTARLTNDFTIFNDFTITAGTFNANNFNTNIGRNWSNAGAFTAGTGVLSFNGTGNQTITKAGGETFYNLTINKTSGSVILSNDLIVSNILNMSNGNFDCGVNTLTLGTSTSNVGTLNYTAGVVLGKMKRWINSTGTSVLFPIGTSSLSRATSILFNNLTSGTLAIDFVSSNPGSNGLPLSDGGFTVQNQFTEGYWNLVSADGLTSSNYDIELNGEAFISYSLTASTRIIKRNDASSSWTLSGTHSDLISNIAKRLGMGVLPTQLGFGKTVCSTFNASTISGLASVCINDANVSYSVTNTVGNSFNWTCTGGAIISGQGTSAINVTWGTTGGVGEVKVIEQNNCGDSNTALVLPITIHPFPTTAIVGSATVAQNQTGVAYSVNNTSGYTYSWSVSGGTIASGSGTSAITVDWGAGASGSVSVTVTPTCGSPEVKSLVITIRGPIVSAVSGNWNTPGTWVGGVVPTVNDYVTISSGHTVLMDLNSASCYKLTIDGTANWTSSYTVNVGAGGLVINSTGNITGIVAGVLTSTGGLVLNSTLTSNTVKVLLQTNTGKLITGTGSLAKLTVNVDVTNNGNITVRDMLDGTATLTQGTNATLKLNMPTVDIFNLVAGSAGNTVTYESSFAQTIKKTSYRHLTLLGAGTKTLGGAISISGNLSYSDCTFDVSASNYSITILGNWNSTNATFNKRFGLVLFRGTTEQYITGETSFENLTVNNTANGLNLNNNIYVSGILSFIDGVITTNSNQVIITSTSTSSISGYSSSCFINGNLNRYISSNTSTYVFPIGNGLLTSNYYRLDYINNNILGVSSIVGAVNTISEINNNVDSRINTIQDGYYFYNVTSEKANWILTPNSTPTGGSFGVNLYIANISGLVDNEFYVVSRNNSSVDYADWNSNYLTTSVPSPSTSGRTITSGYANRAGYTDFENYGVGMIRNTLVQFNLISSSNLENSQIQDINVDLNFTLNSPASVDYSVSGTATSGVDYTLSSGTLNFPIGTKTQAIPLQLINDTELETSETVIITLSNPSSGINLGTNTTYTFTITDDDSNRDIQFESSVIFAQENQTKSEYWEWVKQIEGTGNVTPRAMTLDSQNNTLLLCVFDGQIIIENETFVSFGGNDILLVKINSSGDLVWVKQAGSNDNDDPMDVEVDTDDNVYITGGFRNTATFNSQNIVSVSGQDIFLAKYNSSGLIIWAKNIGSGPDGDRAEGMSINGHEIVVVGILKNSVTFGDTTLTSEYSNLNNFVAKFDTSGVLNWVYQIKGNNVYSKINKISTDGSNYYVAGNFSGTVYFDLDTYVSQGLNDLILYKIDNSGNIVWVKTSGGTQEDYWSDIDVDSNGNIYLTGKMYGNGNIETQSITINGTSDLILAKYDTDGNLIFAKNNGGEGLDYGLGINSLNNTIQVAGLFSGQLNWGESVLNSQSNVDNDAFVGILDLDGNYILAKQIEGEGFEQASFVQISDDGNAFVAGNFSSTNLLFNDTTIVNSGNLDGFLSKYKYASIIPVILSVVDLDNVTSIDYSITGGTALGSGVDYTLTNGTLNFSPGETISKINVILNDDIIEESDETILFTLSNPSNGVLGLLTDLTYTITDNDVRPTIEFKTSESFDYESCGNYVVEVDMSNIYAFDVNVDYSISGTAVNGLDYTLSNGTLTIPVDSTHTFITIPIISDDIIEANETLILTISNPVNAILGSKTSFTLNIYDAPKIPTVQNVCRHGSGIVSLEASGSNTDVYSWYDQLTGGNLLAKSSIYTPYVASSKNFYVSASRMESSLDFSEANDYVRIPNSGLLDLAGTLTIEMKVKSSSWGVRQHLFEKQYNGEGRLSIEVGGAPRFLYGNSVSYASFLSSQSLPTNQWVHVALVRDMNNSLVSLYINGVFVRSSTATYSGSQTANDLILGETFNGELDEIRIWNTARTATEISENKNSILLGTESGLVAYYNMNNGHGLVLEDLSPNNLDGILVNMDSSSVWKVNNVITESNRTIATVTISNNPVDLGVDRSVADSTVLDATNSYATYLWNDNSTNQTLSVTRTGTYWVSVVDGSGCFDIDTVNIDLLPSMPSVQNVCRNGEGTATLDAVSEYLCRWYNVPTGGTVLSTLKRYTTPKLTSTTNYYVTGAKMETSLDFGSSNDYVRVPNAGLLDLAGTLTVEMKVKSSSWVVRQHLFEKQYNGEGRLSIEAGGAPRFLYGNTVSYASFLSSQSIPTNEWVHVALVRDMSTSLVSLYINGVFVRSSTATYSGSQTNNDLIIGETFNGELDEIRIWNTARTATEISENKNKVLIGTESGLVAYYNMNNGHGLVLEDLTPNNLDGILVNMDSTSVWKHNSVISESSRRMATVTISNNPVDLGVDRTVSGSTVLDATNSYATYLWNDNSTNQTLNVTQTGTYWVSVVDGSGCFDIDTVNITVNVAKSLVLDADDSKLNEITKEEYQFNNFNAQLNGDIIDLKWLIENEMNTYYYTIERSIDTEKFDVIDVIFAGDKTSIADYYIFDDKPIMGTSYYRLKQTDLSGKSIYSDLIKVEYGKEHKQVIFKIYPNPVQREENFYVNMSGLESNNKVLVQVIDALGRERYSKVIFTNSEGEVLEAMDPEGRLEPGTYFIVSSSYNMLESKKLIIK